MKMPKEGRVRAIANQIAIFGPREYTKHLLLPVGELTVHLVRPAPSRFTTNIIVILLDNTPWYSICGTPVGQDAGVLGEQKIFYKFTALICRLLVVPEW